MEHLTIPQLLLLVRRGENPAHANECAFCREQLALARDYLSFVSDDDMTANEIPNEVLPHLAYRLAAQTVDLGPVMFRLRRTWYLEDNSIVLRVIEDIQRKVLTGFFISEQVRSARALIRFDGIDRDFIPDLNGVFEIGSASIDIEPMNVTVSRS